MGRTSCRDCAALEFVKAKMKVQLLIDMGICISCMKRPARERPPPKCKRPNRTNVKNYGVRFASYDRARFTDCEECARRRTEQNAKHKLSRMRDALVAEAKRAERDALEHD